MADQFGEAVMKIRADDAELRKTLTEDERLVRDSTGKMQGNFDKLKIQTQQVGGAAVSSSAAFGAFGAQAGALGGTVGMLGGRVASLGTAFAGLGAAMFGPIGLILAAAAAVGIIIQQFQKWKQEVADADEALKGLQERLKAQNDAFKKRVQLLEDQIILEKTGVNRALERMRPRERELTLQFQSIKAEKIAQAASEALSLSLVDRVIALRQETQILQGQKTIYDFIESSLEKQARLSRDKALTDKASADAAKAEQTARRAVAGPQTPGEARGAIADALAMIKMQENTVRQVNRMLESMLKRGLIDEGRFDQLTAAFGLPSRPSSDPAQDRFRSGGVQAGAFRGGITFGAVSAGESEIKKQTGILEKIKTATEGTRSEAAQRGQGGGAQ